MVIVNLIVACKNTLCHEIELNQETTDMKSPHSLYTQRVHIVSLVASHSQLSRKIRGYHI